MILLVVLSSFLIAGITFYQYAEQANDYNQVRLLRKEDQLKRSLFYWAEHFDQTTDLPSGRPTPIPDSLSLWEMSDIHNLDFELYTPKGQLAQASFTGDFRPIKTPELDPALLASIYDVGHRVFTVEDPDPYMSSYSALVDARGLPWLILHIPYQDDYGFADKELREFLMRLGMVYLLLLAVGIVLAFGLSRYITRSVQMERELAWREMAKQVAHEIKNPLTPMRLNVQLLPTQFTDLSPKESEKLDTHTQAMLEQIDLLSDIATAFSHYAQMPQANADVFDWAEETKQARMIYPQPWIAVKGAEGPIMVSMDRSQWTRVVTNLLNNSIQALAEVNHPRITIEFTQEGRWGICRFTDNGPGVPAHLIQRIFEPRFTTKSSGMGLGLAVVRTVMQASGGSIAFEPNPHGGAQFILRLPRKQNTHEQT